MAMHISLFADGHIFSFLMGSWDGQSMQDYRFLFIKIQQCKNSAHIVLKEGKRISVMNAAV